MRHYDSVYKELKEDAFPILTYNEHGDVTIPRISSRSSYLAYIKEWKKQYKRLSKVIRELKLSIKDDQRRKGYSEDMYPAMMMYKRLATCFMEARALSKEKAQENYKREYKETA